MLDFVQDFKLKTMLVNVMFASMILFAGGVRADAPNRVVSISLCTDQLAMLVAKPNQLISVSYISHDPLLSAFYDQAILLPVNYGAAEEIFLLRPDMVLAGQYSDPLIIQMLQRMGVRVEILPEITSLDQMPLNIKKLGELLNQTEKATKLASSYQLRLDEFDLDIKPSPRAAFFQANGYTLGPSSLSGDILRRSGYQNVAVEYGVEFGGRLTLENLVLSQPDLIISSKPYPRQSRSEELLQHPILSKIQEQGAKLILSDRNWSCATPKTFEVMDELVKLRKGLSYE